MAFRGQIWNTCACCSWPIAIAFRKIPDGIWEQFETREKFEIMFQLKKAKFPNLKSQIVTSRWGGLRCAAPYAFTEQGVAMLSSVLKRHHAVED